MYILAFETSCDDTSIAIMKNDTCIALSTRTQIEHIATGGVVPEVAARSHANALFPCLEDVLNETGLDLSDINYIACTMSPGLAPSLLTGIVVAETLAKSLQIPLLPIDHIESHIFANLLDRTIDDLIFPSVVLTVSGGHTELYEWTSLYELRLLGQTIDDAAGECFDKVSKMLGMGFPGGKIIADLATKYQKSFSGIFPVVLLENTSLDFSFSGLKSAVKRYIDREITTLEGLTDAKKIYIAFEFQETMIQILSEKLLRAQRKGNYNMMILAGGVSANTLLQNRISENAKALHIPFIFPKKIMYSMDNAAMIGIRAYYEILRAKEQ